MVRSAVAQCQGSIRVQFHQATADGRIQFSTVPLPPGLPLTFLITSLFISQPMRFVNRYPDVRYRLQSSTVHQRNNLLIKSDFDVRHPFEVSHSSGAVERCVLYLVLLGQVVQRLYGGVQARHRQKRRQVCRVRRYDDEAVKPIIEFIGTYCKTQK